MGQAYGVVPGKQNHRVPLILACKNRSFKKELLLKQPLQIYFIQHPGPPPTILAVCILRVAETGKAKPSGSTLPGALEATRYPIQGTGRPVLKANQTGSREENNEDIFCLRSADKICGSQASFYSYSYSTYPSRSLPLEKHFSIIRRPSSL
jgi:hypothetical protein